MIPRGKIMKKAIHGFGALAVVVLAIGGFNGTSEANQLWTSTNLCVGGTPTESAKITYTSYGVQNNNTSLSATVECGTVIPGNTNEPFDLWFYAYDRNSTTNVCCTMYLTDFNGGVLQSSAPCTTGSSAAVQLVMGGMTPAGASRANLSCTIPAKQAGSLSHLISVLAFTAGPL